MRLDGSVAARLFMEISFGPTVVPLLSPANRDESGGRPVRKFLRTLPMI